ncbi:transposase, partial [Pseudomonas protegens]
TPKCWTSTSRGVMKKYTEQAKLSVVEDYCSGSAGHREVAHRHGVNASSLRKWIAAYQALGAAGLKSKRKKNYSPEFKLNVLQRMREEGNRPPSALSYPPPNWPR